MLVKLGNAWVNPSNVEVVDFEVSDGRYGVVVSTSNYRTQQFVVKDATEAMKVIDDYAGIVNSSLSTQSFGNPDEGQVLPVPAE